MLTVLGEADKNNVSHNQTDKAFMHYWQRNWRPESFRCLHHVENKFLHKSVFRFMPVKLAVGIYRFNSQCLKLWSHT